MITTNITPGKLYTNTIDYQIPGDYVQKIIIDNIKFLKTVTGAKSVSIYFSAPFLKHISVLEEPAVMMIEPIFNEPADCLKLEDLEKNVEEIELSGSLVVFPIRYGKQVVGGIYVLLSVRRIPLAFNYNSCQMVSNIIQLGIENAKLQGMKMKEHTDLVHSLSISIEIKDKPTYEHSRRVQSFASFIAKIMNLPTMQVNLIRDAGILHDLGKVGIRSEVLLKPAKLSPTEYEEIKKHPVFGYNMLKEFESLESVAKIILHHHERYDGSGYPDKLKGDEIPFESRILAVADAFEAIIKDRPYRPAALVSVAIHELKKNAGTQFDPDVVKTFVDATENGDFHLFAL